jgi:quercetin dioxygenase-like cupin family protein
MTEVLHFAGSEQTVEIVLDGAATGGALALMTLRVPAGAGAPFHRHTRESETLLVRAGSLTVEAEGARRELGPGEAVFLERGVLHAFSAAEPAVVDVIAAPAGLEDFFRAVCVRDPADPPPGDAVVAAALERHGLDFSGA